MTVSSQLRIGACRVKHRVQASPGCDSQIPPMALVPRRHDGVAPKTPQMAKGNLDRDPQLGAALGDASHSRCVDVPDRPDRGAAVVEDRRRRARLPDLPARPGEGLAAAVGEAARGISRELGAPRWPYAAEA